MAPALRSEKGAVRLGPAGKRVSPPACVAAGGQQLTAVGLTPQANRTSPKFEFYLNFVISEGFPAS